MLWRITQILGNLILLIPGNHDVNIVDRANPARLDLPTSPNKRLRKVRTLSALAAIQGERVRVVDQASRRLGDNLATVWAPHVARIAAFADAGKPALTKELTDLWARVFPMVLPPDRDDGLGHHAAELECRHAFFVHQCARHDLVGTSARDQRRERAISPRMLGDRAASSCRRVPLGRRKPFPSASARR